MAGDSRNDILIFLDMDGVVADTELHAHNTGVEMDSKTADDLSREWWASIPPCAGAKEFYDDLRAIGRVRFLTGVKKGSGCRIGKEDWLKTFVPERGWGISLDMIPLASKDKWLVAAPGRILIDDREENIRDWIAYGGIGILHKGDFAETLRQVKVAIQNMRPALKPSPGPSP